MQVKYCSFMATTSVLILNVSKKQQGIEHMVQVGHNGNRSFISSSVKAAKVTFQPTYNTNTEIMCIIYKKFHAQCLQQDQYLNV